MQSLNFSSLNLAQVTFTRRTGTVVQGFLCSQRTGGGLGEGQGLRRGLFSKDSFLARNRRSRWLAGQQHDVKNIKNIFFRVFLALLLGSQ